jgi:hypothetical protein
MPHSLFLGDDSLIGIGLRLYVRDYYVVSNAQCLGGGRT